MAMVLDAFASYVVDMLTQVATDEVKTMLGVSGEIDKMGDKLRDLKNFLADADRRNITDETVREWVGQLKRAMYEATDILDLCQLKAMERGPSSVNTGCFNPLLFCMRNPFHAREIGTRIKALNQRLDDIKERSAAFNFINLGSYGDHNSKTHASHHGNPSQETVGDFDRSSLVGDKIEEDTRALLAQIMQTGKDASNDIKVVAIVGVGGIGKTTLAQKVFNDDAIQGGFSKKIWLNVNQNFSEVELLRRAIIGAAGNAQLAGIAKDALHRALMQALKDHKTLLVMDDVWDKGAWEGVLKIPLANAAASGSRVLITTREGRVAQGVKAIQPYQHVDTLAPDDAWSLLKKQVCSSEIDEDHINTLKDTGLKIIQKCGCLPIAVKVMGGLLRERGGLRRDWQQVLDDSKWSTTKMPDDLNHTVYLSYEYMPAYLKQCFLFYSLLPKSRIFSMDKVVSMWISEGFIHGNSNDLEELGENYYKELVSRNLIEPDKSYIDDLWVCSMHDVVRSFAQYMTKDEALVAHDGDNDILTKLSSRKFLRLSIETNLSQSGELDWKSLGEQQTMRTLISTIQFKAKPSDSLVTFSSLRTLHIESSNVDTLVESLHQLKHLRYLKLVNSHISMLPANIDKMKLLQFLDLWGCKNLVNLPDTIVKLVHLRLLSLPSASMVPRGFRGLTSLRRLLGFQAHMDGDWCSLDELGPLSQLRFLELHQLENVSSALFAANASLGKKIHLIDLLLYCTSRVGDDWSVKEKEGVSEEEQQQIKKVFDDLCPPPSVEYLEIIGYFGQQFPSWMSSTSSVTLNNLKIILLSNLACCTQLPNGLCQLAYLQSLWVNHAPCIRRVGTGFLQTTETPFPRLNKMSIKKLVEWEEWEWEEQVQAMPMLENLTLDTCKLWRVPPGLASNARALKVLEISRVQHLSYLENFPSVVELTVCGSPDLERITNIPNLRKLAITNCPKLNVVESIPALERLNLVDYSMEILTKYMRDIKPRHLQLLCRLWLLSLVAAGQSGPEWDKFSHVEHVKAYARDGDNQRKWYVLYARGDNLKLDSNVRCSTVLEETLSSCMVDAQGFESLYRMRRSTFSYVCSLVRIPFLEDMMARDHTFVDGRVLSLQDRVAVALRMLNSGDSPVTVGSSLGVSESTCLLVTKVFVEAMDEQTTQHFKWPGSAETEKIKRKFDKIHGLPNCCGVVHTTHIIFDHEKNDAILLQAVVDADMRFIDLWLEPSSSAMNQPSTWHDSNLFKDCEGVTWLNGRRLNLSDGCQVREYIIGGVGYPLLPWLLTPYQVENDHSLPDSKVEFNRRHLGATAMAVRVLERLKGTWKCLLGRGWHPNNKDDQWNAISTCCMVHNILIDMEAEKDQEIVEDEDQEENYTEQLCQFAEEDAVRVRDALSQHLIKTGGKITQLIMYFFFFAKTLSIYSSSMVMIHSLSCSRS